MVALNSHNIAVMFFSLAILLGVARALGEVAQRLRQPSVLGELLAGVILGPTILGRMAPAVSETLFPLHGVNAIALDSIATLAIGLFLLVAGMEVDLSTAWKQGKTGGKIGLSSIAIPFVVAMLAAFIAPEALGRMPGSDPLIFALFFAIAISISALPIIVKILIDMGLYRSDLGMVVISAAILNDIIGWVVFAVILGFLSGSTGAGVEVVTTIALTLIFIAGMLTLGRSLIHKVLPFVQAYTRWPAGELSFALILGFLGAAFTEWIGIHAILGAFIVGVAIGDSSHLRERSRVIIGDFVSFIFAPVFFASIGLKVDFLAHFDVGLVLVVLLMACASKLVGGTLGARWGGMSRQESFAVGFAMVSVGAMGIIVGLIALNAGIIDERLFVALIVMAMVTSMISGPSMCLILHKEKKWKLRDVLSAKLFIRGLQARTRREVIREMVTAVGEVGDLDAGALELAVWAREEVMSTGIGNGVALPHARVVGLDRVWVAVGISSRGIDFDAPDGKLANLIFLILTPGNDPSAQLDVAAEITRRFREPEAVVAALHTENFTDFLALMSSGTQLR
ncbi:MAG: cation:proton antiporter [Desulfuromonadaceae bacterium]|nr:cation:proton antiporter [Desulfuromonadaceae bacterium]